MQEFSVVAGICTAQAALASGHRYEHPPAFVHKAVVCAARDEMETPEMADLDSLCYDYFARCESEKTQRATAKEEGRTARHEATQERKAANYREKQETERCRVRAEMDMHREHQLTEREKIRCESAVLMVRERRLAFEKLCDALEAGLRSGDRALDSIREQFGQITQLLIERDIPEDERQTLIGLLGKLISQQDSAMSANRQVIDQNALEPWPESRRRNGRRLDFGDSSFRR